MPVPVPIYRCQHMMTLAAAAAQMPSESRLPAQSLYDDDDDDRKSISWEEDFFIDRDTEKYTLTKHRWLGVDWDMIIVWSSCSSGRFSLEGNRYDLGMFVGYDNATVLQFVRPEWNKYILVTIGLIGHPEDAEEIGHGDNGTGADAKKCRELLSQPHPYTSQGRRDERTDFGHKPIIQHEEFSDPEFRRLYMRDKLNPATGKTQECLRIKVNLKLIRHITKAPSGWNSKRNTGMVGLQNLGATCYLNALLQMLFYINKFRKAVYDMPLPLVSPSSGNSNNDQQQESSTTLALQSVFKNLQLSDSAVSTEELTHAFGWTSAQAFLQQDVQEMLRVLLDKLEEKMKGTSVDGVVRDLFAGTSSSFIKCINVPYESKREEDFYDIQLDVKGCEDVYASFKRYIAKEVLDGDNQYDAGEQYGKQDAEKGVIFTYLPPVLTIHLKRFDFDLTRMAFAKIHDEFKFPLRLSLDAFIAEDAPEANKIGNNYVLHSVLVHNGDVGGGHYYAYIRPSSQYNYGAPAESSAASSGGKWFEFNDETVIKVAREVATENTWGRRAGDGHFLGIGSAYMLVYIKETEALDVMPTISDQDIPSTLLDRLASESDRRRAEDFMDQRKKLFKTLVYFTENDVARFKNYSRNHDFVNATKSISYLEGSTYLNIVHQIAKVISKPPHSFRLWITNSQTNMNNIRPVSAIQSEIYHNKVSHNCICIFVEMLKREELVDYSKSYDDGGCSDDSDAVEVKSVENITLPPVNYYSLVLEKEEVILGQLRVCFKENKPQIGESLEQEFDEVEGCGIGSSNKLIKLYLDDKPECEVYIEKLGSITRELQKKMVFKCFEEEKMIIFVKIYDRFLELPSSLFNKFDNPNDNNGDVDNDNDDDGDENENLYQYIGGACQIKYANSFVVSRSESFEAVMLNVLNYLYNYLKHSEVHSSIMQKWFTINQPGPIGWSDDVKCCRTKCIGDHAEISIHNNGDDESYQNSQSVSSILDSGDVLTLYLDISNVATQTSAIAYYKHMESQRLSYFVPIDKNAKDIVLKARASDINLAKLQRQQQLQQQETGEPAIDSSSDDDDVFATITFILLSSHPVVDVLNCFSSHSKIKPNHIILTPQKSDKTPSNVLRGVPPVVFTPVSNITIEEFFWDRKINITKNCACYFSYTISPFQLWFFDQATSKCIDNRSTHRFFEINIVDIRLRQQSQQIINDVGSDYSTFLESNHVNMSVDQADGEEISADSQGGNTCNKRRRLEGDSIDDIYSTHMVNAVPSEFLSDVAAYLSIRKGETVGFLSNILRKNLGLPRADIVTSSLRQQLGIDEDATFNALASYVALSSCDAADVSSGHTTRQPLVLFTLDDGYFFKEALGSSAPVDGLPLQWLEGRCAGKDSRHLCVQMLTYHDMLFMAGLSAPKRSMCVFVVNFTLLGSSAVACAPSKMGGPFLAYVCEDDDYDALLDRLADISGDKDALQQCRLAIIKDKKPFPLPRGSASAAGDDVSSPCIFDICREKYPLFDTKTPLSRLKMRGGAGSNDCSEPSVTVPLLGIQRPASTVASARRVSSSITISG